jgi:hypothetical protein
MNSSGRLDRDVSLPSDIIPVLLQSSPVGRAGEILWRSPVEIASFALFENATAMCFRAA